MDKEFFKIELEENKYETISSLQQNESDIRFALGKPKEEVRLEELICSTKHELPIMHQEKIESERATENPFCNLNLFEEAINIAEQEKHNFNTEERKAEVEFSKRKRINKAKLSKHLRNTGKEYISIKTNKIIPPRRIKERCDKEKCNMVGKQCGEITNEDRQKIFDAYHTLGDLTRQRLYLLRHVEVLPKKRTTSKEGTSRRQNSRIYYLSARNTKFTVCKKMFFSTLGIPERILRTALSKIDEVGVLEGEMRGGRQRSRDCLEKEKNNRKEIKAHINRFLLVKSQNCQEGTNKRYLQPDVTLKKMYNSFVEEQEAKGCDKIPSFSTYRKIFKTQNLSFLHTNDR